MNLEECSNNTGVLQTPLFAFNEESEVNVDCTRNCSSSELRDQIVHEDPTYSNELIISLGNHVQYEGFVPYVEKVKILFSLISYLMKSIQLKSDSYLRRTMKFVLLETDRIIEESFRNINLMSLLLEKGNNVIDDFLETWVVIQKSIYEYIANALSESTVIDLAAKRTILLTRLNTAASWLLRQQCNPPKIFSVTTITPKVDSDDNYIPEHNVITSVFVLGCRWCCLMNTLHVIGAVVMLSDSQNSSNKSLYLLMSGLFLCMTFLLSLMWNRTRRLAVGFHSIDNSRLKLHTYIALLLSLHGMLVPGDESLIAADVFSPIFAVFSMLTFSSPVTVFSGVLFRALLSVGLILIRSFVSSPDPIKIDVFLILNLLSCQAASASLAVLVMMHFNQNKDSFLRIIKFDPHYRALAMSLTVSSEQNGGFSSGKLVLPRVTDLTDISDILEEINHALGIAASLIATTDNDEIEGVQKILFRIYELVQRHPSDKSLDNSARIPFSEITDFITSALNLLQKENNENEGGDVSKLKKCLVRLHQNISILEERRISKSKHLLSLDSVSTDKILSDAEIPNPLTGKGNTSIISPRGAYSRRRTQLLQQLTKSINASDYVDDLSNGAVILPLERGPHAVSAKLIHNSTSIFAVDEEYLIVYWGDHLSRVTGFSSEVMKGKSLLSFLLDAGDQTRMQNTVQAAIKGEISPPELFKFRTELHDVILLVQLQLCTPIEPTFDDAQNSFPSVAESMAMGSETLRITTAKQVIIGCGRDLGLENSLAQYCTWLLGSIRHPIKSIKENLGKDDPLMLGLAESALDTINTFEPLCSQLHDISFKNWLPVNIENELLKIVSETPDVNISINIQMDEIAKFVYMDIQRLHSVLQFLVSDSTARMEPGSTLSLAALAQSKSESSCLRFIIDTPLPTSECGDIFVPRRGSDGLSIAKVKVAVKQMGGHLKVDGNKFKTTFNVTLPLILARSHDDDQNQSQDKINHTGESFQTLVFEPCIVERHQILHALWKRGHAATVLLDHFESVQLEAFDLIIVDHDTELAKRIETLFPMLKSKIVFTSDSNPVSAISDNNTTTPCEWLQKPIRMKTLLTILRKTEKQITDRKAVIEKLDALRASFGTDQQCPWTRKEKLGKGAFAEVFKAVNLITNGVMAVKIMDTSEKSDAQLEIIFNEIKLLSDHRHENIIHYFYCERSGTELHIMMEFSGGGTLAALIESHGKLDTNTTSCCLSDLLSALDYLHENSVIHRDIKSDNILLSVSGTCKLSDFGCAIVQAEQIKTFVGTPSYMAPEVVNEESYTCGVDIWSVGILTYEMLTGHTPWSGCSNWIEIAVKIGKLTSFESIPLHEEPLDDQELDFISKCLSVDPLQRSSADELLHSFLVSENNRRDEMLLPSLSYDTDEETFHLSNQNRSQSYLNPSSYSPLRKRNRSRATLNESICSHASNDSSTSYMSMVPQSQEVDSNQVDKIKRRSTAGSMRRIIVSPRKLVPKVQEWTVGD